MSLIQNILMNKVEFSTIFNFSLLFLFIFSFIFSRYLGYPLKKFSYFIFYKKQNLLIIFIFVFSLFLIVYLNNNIISLGDKISITTTHENIKFEIKVDLIKTAFEGASNTGAYLVGEETPDWKNNFIFPDFPINSPLESNSSLIQFVLDALNNHLIINFITVYLLLMLLIIIICKFILNKDIKFNRLDNYPLGIYINKFLIKYISIWQKSGNVWIIFIIISLIFFNTVVTFSTYQLILLIK